MVWALAEQTNVSAAHQPTSGGVSERFLWLESANFCPSGLPLFQSVRVCLRMRVLSKKRTHHACQSRLFPIETRHSLQGLGCKWHSITAISRPQSVRAFKGEPLY